MEWMDDAFTKLPGSGDLLFQKLWSEKQLYFNQYNSKTDPIDEYSARLVCAALTRRARLYLVLPDSQPHRPALLFSTALIRYWYDARKLNTVSPKPVLYFGSTVGIREQLQLTAVRGVNVNLAEVFQQQDTARGGARNINTSRLVKEQVASPLPHVVTIYSPADPIVIINSYKPCWIAIDSGDAPALPWLPMLLEHAFKQNIPLVGWGQNPLSDCVDDFAKYGSVFSWPVKPVLNSTLETSLSSSVSSLLHNSEITNLQPLILEGPDVETMDTLLQNVGRLLAHHSANSQGSLGNDAIRLHWRFLRSLEGLCTPFDFFEAEVTRYWGLKSFAQLQSACEQFRNACYKSYKDLAIGLEEASTMMSEVLEQIKAADPPLWSALCDLCIEEPPAGEARLVTFASPARKQLFLFALLARHNITEEDLQTIRVWIVSLDELRRSVQQRDLLAESDDQAALSLDKSLRWHPLLVGVPSPLLTPRLLPVLVHDLVSIVIYPYQGSTLFRRIEEWSKKIGPNIILSINALGGLSGVKTPVTLPAITPKLNLSDSLRINTQSKKRTKQAIIRDLWQLVDPVNEVARLFQADDEITQDDINITDTTEQSGQQAGEDQDIWCQFAVEIEFDQGWHATFPPDEIINVIVQGLTGLHLDKRYVRSLKVNDRAMIIHGQHRQDLYGLILSRIHRNPAIELQLALIRRWQQDFASAYRGWRRHAIKNLESLLQDMQNRGSTLTSSFTLRQWLWGNTLCPDDVEDLRRLAEVLDMGFVKQYYRRIYHAAKRLRGLHRSLSIRLNRWLEQQAAGLNTHNDNDLVDADLGLTFGDFRNSLLILRVSKIRTISGLFLRANLGTLERD